MDIKKLISQMTLEEKASLCSGEDFWHTKAVERLGIPATMVSDGPHGLRKQDEQADHLGINESIKAVCFPAACAAAASFDRDVFKQLGEALGDECQHEQVSVLLGPAVNIKRSPLCGRNFEYLSEDPYLAGESAAAYTNAVQSRNIGVSIKHFAANNQEHRRMSSSSDVDERTLREIYFPPFEIAVRKAKPWTVMCSYNRINGVFSSENGWLLNNVLRNEWGFDGYVMTDWGAIVDRVTGIKNGLDLEMPGSMGIRDKKIVEAVRNGTLDEKLLDRAVENILNIVYKYHENKKPETPWDKEAHHALAADLASGSMVLLKNTDGILPLKKGSKIAFIGEFAEKPRYQGGGSSHINSFKVTSALDAVQGIDDITYAKGFDIAADCTTDELMAEAVQASRDAEVAVIFAGLPDVYESEGYDRTHMHLPECQNSLINAIAAVNPNTVVVLHNGAPVEMPWIDSVKGLLEAYLGGQAVGEAVKRILFGEVNPSGRLAETFPLKLEDNPSFLFYGGERNHTEYREGVFVGYRYYDKKKMDVLFPFGYGLSYTTFDYSNLVLDKNAMKDTETLTVSVDVTNTGITAGKEVIQLYVADMVSEAIRPVRELKGFDKVFLNPGETKTVTFTLDKRSFAYYEPQVHDWFVESGDFAIQIGRSSRDIVLEDIVYVSSEDAIPMTYDMNSIFMDINDTEKGRKAAQEFFKKQTGIFGTATSQDDDDESAVSGAMAEAMINYMPLRALMGFNAGNINEEDLKVLLEALNK